MPLLDDSDRDSPEELRALLRSAPRPRFVEAYVIDINGVARGKRLPLTALPRLYSDGLCLPASTVLLDIWGREVEATGLILETGDADLTCRPVPGGLRPLPWSERPGAQLFLQMQDADGASFAGDPRTPLAGAIDRLAARGLTPVVATELEFRLFDAALDEHGRPRPAARCSDVGRRSQLFGLDELGALDVLFADIERACAALALPVDTVIAEQGEGQYEINLKHEADAMRAADQAVLLKRAVKGCARRHGVLASFMAKPFGDAPGNGMHVHLSLLDDRGRNIFDDGGAPSARLMHAVSGLLDSMAETSAVFAPHANSYRRFQAGSHVPLAPTWGRDNRAAALRLPRADAAATRIEHRVAGADANPYLVLAMILAGVDHGLACEQAPPPETQGNAPHRHAQRLPDAWGAALDRFEASDFVGRVLGRDYRAWFAACKRQERECLRRAIPDSEYDAYLQTV